MFKFPVYATPMQMAWTIFFRIFCCLVLLFLILPVLIIIPLSFNVEPYFTFTEGMLAFEKEAYSLRWYQDIIRNGMAAPDAPMDAAWWADMWANSVWIRAIRNSFIIGILATLLATSLGTLAALGLSRSEMPYKTFLTSVLISPMIIPLVITGAGMFYFYSRVGLSQTFLGVVLAHAALGTPFVIIAVTATLVGFDKSLTRASASLGAGPIRTFRKVQMPLILPGVISGGLFAFITSFDEVVIILFLGGPEQRTVPRQMYSGIREQISPTILAVATILVIISVCLLAMMELLRRRTERLKTGSY